MFQENLVFCSKWRTHTSFNDLFGHVHLISIYTSLQNRRNIWSHQTRVKIPNCLANDMSPTLNEDSVGQYLPSVLFHPCGNFPVDLVNCLAHQRCEAYFLRSLLVLGRASDTRAWSWQPSKPRIWAKHWRLISQYTTVSVVKTERFRCWKSCKTRQVSLRAEVDEKPTYTKLERFTDQLTGINYEELPDVWPHQPNTWIALDRKLSESELFPSGSY